MTEKNWLLTSSIFPDSGSGCCCIKPKVLDPKRGGPGLVRGRQKSGKREGGGHGGG